MAFPDLVDAFDLTIGQLQWVVICFVAASGGLLVPFGALGDRLGHATTVLVGGAVSSVAMVANALAPSYGVLLVGRVAQGVGTALVMASAPALATLATPPERHRRAIGLFQAAAAVGLATGPIVGGVVVLAIGWRGVFWFRVPLALALVVLAMRTIGIGTARRQSTTSAAGGLRLAIGSRLRDLGRVDVVVANGLTFAANGAMFATWLLVPSLLVDEMGVAVLASGLALAASPVATALAAARADTAARHIGPRATTTVGLAAMTGGMVVIAAGGSEASPAVIVAALSVIGAGLGLFSVPNMATVMGALPPEAQGVAGSLNLMMRTLGIVTGAAWHAFVFDRAEPSLGFDGALGQVFTLGAGVLVVAAAVAALSRPRSPSSA